MPVFDEAFDTRGLEFKLRVLDEILEGLAKLHGAGIVHGNLHPDAIRRESTEGALRLCDFSFSGGRTTTVTALPAAYQSRHVVTASELRLVDDVHAAGMLGYRILLGPGGPEKVLTGVAEDTDRETLVSAILGEETAAPDGAALFPEGHPSADQIARLLARMTGRLPNSAPYSTAEAALKALRSVVENPSVAKVAFEGNSEIEDDSLTAEVQLKPRAVYTRARVQADVQRILDIYRRQGMYAAQVQFQLI